MRKITRRKALAGWLAGLAGALAAVPAPGGPATAAAVPASSSLRLVASDEFGGPLGGIVNPWVWEVLEGGGGWGNGELQAYTARTANVSTDGRGALRIMARKEAWTGRDGHRSAYTSGRLVSRASVRYGRLEARIQLPTGQGLWPAFWTVGEDIRTRGWPRCGEIDIAESVNRMTAVSGTLHGPTTSGGAWQLTGSAKPVGGLGGGWHTYAVDWRPGSVTWLLDGTPYRTITSKDLPAGAVWAFDKPHLVQLNLAVGGRWPGPPDASTTFPATMLVDYVRVYSLG